MLPCNQTQPLLLNAFDIIVFKSEEESNNPYSFTRKFLPGSMWEGMSARFSPLIKLYFLVNTDMRAHSQYMHSMVLILRLIAWRFVLCLHNTKNSGDWVVHKQTYSAVFLFKTYV